MRSVREVGSAVNQQRKKLRMTQSGLAAKAGLSREAVVRFERGQADLGVRKLLSVLAVLGLELAFNEGGKRGTLDELRRERGGL